MICLALTVSKTEGSMTSIQMRYLDNSLATEASRKYLLKLLGRLPVGGEGGTPWHRWWELWCKEWRKEMGVQESFKPVWVQVELSCSNHLALVDHRWGPNGGDSTGMLRKDNRKNLRSKRRRKSTVVDRGRCNRNFRICFSRVLIRGSETLDNNKGKVTVLKYIRWISACRTAAPCALWFACWSPIWWRFWLQFSWLILYEFN